MRPHERRLSRRFARRAQVRYWIGDDPKARNAFINDVSATGVFIVTPYPVERGVTVRLEILDGDSALKFEAVVARRVWIAPDLRKLGPTGMGVRFLTPEELVDQLKTRGEGRAPSVSADGVFRIVLEDDKDLLEGYAREISQGGFYIPTDDPPALNTELVIEFVLPAGAEEEPLRADATVVQRVPPGQAAGGLPAGIAVAFDKGSELLHRLAPYLPMPSGD